MVCPFVYKIREFGEVGGLAGGVTDDDDVKFVFGGDTMGFASHPGFTSGVQLSVGPGVNVVDPGVVYEFVVG